MPLPKNTREEQAMTGTWKAALLALAAALGAAPAPAQDAYVVGLTGAMTGPAAATYAAAIEGLRLYVDELNARGGVNGKPVRLILNDDQGEPSRAAANAKKLLLQDNVVLLVHSSLSSTYQPVIGEVKRARVPLLFSGSICPKEVYPPADELQFCSTAFGSIYETHMALRYIKENAKEPVRLGLAAMAVPLSRGEIDLAEELSKPMGMTTVDKQIIPPTAPDYTPFATKLNDSGANWVYSAAPWVTQVRTFEALRRLGWNGRFLAIAHVQAEEELARMKDEALYVSGANALFQDELPAHKEIRDAAQRANTRHPVTELTEGWVAGLALEEALKNTAWPPTAEKVLAAMTNLRVDTKGLRGGPIEWTKDNHFRTTPFYRFWHWDAGKNAIVRVQDWTPIEIKK
jgi:branched-chain amino acid transport system substrate-binding protein